MIRNEEFSLTLQFDYSNTPHRMKRIAIFASGNGSNAENIIRYFRQFPSDGKVVLVVCNRAGAGVIERAHRLGVELRVMTRDEINDPEMMLPLMDEFGVDVVVLAGFLLMVPGFLIERYHDRMVNVHPSLLPKYGGKGMYGRYVHEAVVAAGDKESGITIHLVSEQCDEGRIIFQASVSVLPTDTPADVESKIHDLERLHFPRVIHETFCMEK